MPKRLGISPNRDTLNIAPNGIISIILIIGTPSEKVTPILVNPHLIAKVVASKMTEDAQDMSELMASKCLDCLGA